MCQTSQHEHKHVENVEVVSNVEIAPRVWMVVLRAPKMAHLLRAGQFVHLLIDEYLTLRRPFSVCQIRQDEICIMYAVVGKGTELLTQKKTHDESMSVIGPCGNSWPHPAVGSKALLVGGGLGAAPLGMLAHELFEAGTDFHFIQAGRTDPLVIGRGFHESIRRDIEFATDDGSLGFHGLITEPVKNSLQSGEYSVVYVCGPEIMQRAVVAVCANFQVATYVSLERLMACGIGACLSCNVATKQGPQKVCVDGPIFLSEDLEFDDVARSSIH